MGLIYNITNSNYLPLTKKVERYSDKSVGLIPIKIITNNKEHYLLFSTNQLNIQSYLEDDQTNELNVNLISAISVNDCVDKCQTVLGLKIHEIAKLLKISRATLDLHRKGSNIKSMTKYHQLYKFMINVENLHGHKLRNYTRNVLIERKTLIQHLFINSNNLDTIFPLLDILSNKIQHISFSETEYDPAKLRLRTYGIGKMV
ncbi:hypothetical protein [Thorsellia anophelis]|uniref:Uncharacterized protein n=1 Tax=Thorsellia anophelis DSM 18579 TaxID=1123402 RepID=A0A1I0BBH1_9GAMM|nr:hypothetical protein [Thorsellia anophelis]SET03505.1 hypothetical protein SAMN02583745_01202 [Thorsellia anophelis DSM 18579]